MIVVDTSVVIKWLFKDEEDSITAFDLYEKHLRKAEEIVAPQILFYEAANVLATKSKIKQNAIKSSMTFLYQANLIVYQEKRDELIQAALLAKKYKTSVYDMLYAVVAKNKKCVLVTADENFVKKTKFRHVKRLKDLADDRQQV